MGHIYRYDIDTFPLFHSHETESGEQCIWSSIFPVFEDSTKIHPFKNLNRGGDEFQNESYHIHTRETVCQCGAFSAPTFLIDIHLMIQRERYLVNNPLNLEFNQIYLPFFQSNSKGEIDFFKLCMHIIKLQGRSPHRGVLEIVHTYSSSEAPELLRIKLEKFWGAAFPDILFQMEHQNAYSTWKDNQDLDILVEPMFWFRRIDTLPGFVDIEGGWD
jgi:hypothetical protein